MLILNRQEVERLLDLDRLVDAEALVKSLVVVESRAVALASPPVGSNDLTWAIRDGFIRVDHFHAEVGEVVSGKRPGRTSPHEITLYKSVGVAVQDAVAARLTLDAAIEQGVGREIEI
jgi:ornithine cyclodeaminase/alanine dehydrogenase-like protein (mu-crystallin family)